MSRSSYLFAGIFGSFAVSCVALVVIPQFQIGGLSAQVDEENNDVYPVWNGRQGRDVYIREGCYYCHSQQVRDLQNGTDIERGWGSRRTVARDYIYENPPLLGSSRIGPDLSNVGSKDWRDEPASETVKKPAMRGTAWQLKHLYDPTLVIRESNMPPYRYLFAKKKTGGQPAPDALDVPCEEGYEIVPTDDARELVAYLQSLDRTHPLPEAKGAAGSAPAKPAAPAAAAAPAPAPAAK